MTVRKKRFIDEYRKCGDGVAAAINAGYDRKYAARQARRLLCSDDEIKAFLDGLDREKNLACSDEVLLFLSMVMRGEAIDGVAMGAREQDGAVPALNLRTKAAELLGKYYGLFGDKPQQDNFGVVQIINNIPRGDNDDGA